jgi:Zn-dependent protease with chaperone function
LLYKKKSVKNNFFVPLSTSLLAFLFLFSFSSCCTTIVSSDSLVFLNLVHGFLSNYSGLSSQVLGTPFKIWFILLLVWLKIQTWSAKPLLLWKLRTFPTVFRYFFKVQKLTSVENRKQLLSLIGKPNMFEVGNFAKITFR